MAQQPTIVSGQNIIVPAPQAGDNVTVTSSPSGNLTFEFDINAAEPTRVDNDLVLQTPEGSVTIGNFFAVGEESLPTLTLSDGVVVDASDFFDGSGVDMTTAAGPTGARADGSGTNYDDGAGALIDGIDRLGSLGNFHWGREVEYTGADLGLLGPMGDFTFGITTEWGMSVIAGVYEDGRPNQHLYPEGHGEDKTAAGKISLTFDVGPGTTVGNIVFSGFSDALLEDQGTFWLGDPENGGVPLSQADTYVFTEGQFTSPGVYYIPGENNRDDDIDFTISVTFTGPNGASVTQSQTGTIIVDAVADKPDMGASNPDYEGFVSDGSVKEGVFDKDTGVESAESEEKVSLTKVTVQATIEFFDYKDGSEEHYALLESPGDGWTCDQGEAVSIWVDASGNPVADQGNPPAGAVQKDYFAVQVPNDDIASAGGSPTIDFILNPPAGVEVKDGDSFELNTGAWAHENPTDSGELSLANNDAYDFGKVTGQHEVPKLEVSMSWAYESGRGDKHDSSSSHTPPAGLVGDGSEAAVTFSVPSGSEINEITLDVSGWTYGDASADARGTLEYNGVALTPDSNGKITITVNPAGSQVDLVFKPNPDCNIDGDLPLQYDVKVTASDGSSLTYGGGKGAISIDAVADTPEDVGVGVDDVPVIENEASGFDETSKWQNPYTGSGQASDKGFETSTYKPKYENSNLPDKVVSMTVSAHFADTDGSETHSLLVEAFDGWTPVLSADASDAGFTLSGKLAPTAEVPFEHYEIIVPEGYQYGAGTPNVILEITYEGQLNKDFKEDVRVVGKAEEEVPHGPALDDSNREVDASNNIAFTPGQAGNIHIEFVNSTLTVKAGWAAEDNHYYQYHENSHLNNPTAGGTAGNKGAIFSMSLTEAGGTSDQFATVTLTYNGAQGVFTPPAGSTAVFKDANGNVISDLQAYSGEVNVTLTFDTPTQNFTGHFVPKTNNSADDIKVDYDVTVTNNGSIQEYTGHSNITIDAVADKPTEVKHNGASYEDGSFIDPTDPDQAAKPGETLTIKGIEVKFGDYKDGSENHHVVIQKNTPFKGEDDKNTTTGIPTQDIVIRGMGAFGACTQTIHFDAENPTASYIILNINGTETRIGADGKDSTGKQLVDGNWVKNMTDGGSLTQSSGGDQYYKLPVANELLKETEGKVTVDEVQVTAPEVVKDEDVTVKVGGYAEEAEKSTANDAGNKVTDPSRETTEANNHASTLKDVEFKVGAVTSKPDFNVSTVFENAFPEAHLGNVDPNQDMKLGTITMQGLDKGETATVTLTFSAGKEGSPVDLSDLLIADWDKDNGEWVLKGDNWEVTGINTNPDGSYSLIDNGDGTYSIEVTITGDGKDVQLPFYPGGSYNSEDIKVDYDVSIRDDASGETKTWDSTEQGSGLTSDKITVDAVAQKPGIENAKTDGRDTTGDAHAVDADGDGKYDKLVPGGKVSVNVTVTFEDYLDGSEEHFLYLEWNPDVALNHNDADCITYLDKGGNEQTISIPKPLVFQVLGDKVFVKVPVDNADLEACGGELNLTIDYMASANASDTSLTIRADAHDNEEQVGLGTVTGGGNFGSTNANNLASKETDVELKFSKAGSLSIKVAENLYEGDQPGAHTGSTAQAWGTELEFKASLGAHDTLDELSITHKGGTLYIIKSGVAYPDKGDANYSQAMEDLLGNSANYEIIPSGALTSDQIQHLLNGGHLHFIPETNKDTATGTSDTDINISYDYVITNHESGHNPPQGENVKLVVDAVAQVPEIKADWDGRKEADGVHTIKVDYQFFDEDGSENQYILVKYIPGATVKGHLPDGTEVQAANDFFFVTNPDGSVTQYVKIPVTSDASKPVDGGKGSIVLEIDVNDVYVGELPFEEGGTGPLDSAGNPLKSDVVIEIGGGTVEKVGEGDRGELTYHNNTAVGKADGSHALDIPTHDHTGGLPHLIFEAGYEDGTQNAHLGDLTQNGDAKITICPVGSADTVTELTLTYNPAQGTVVIDGIPIVIENEEYWPDGISLIKDSGTGEYTITIKNPGEEVSFRPGDFSGIKIEPDDIGNDALAAGDYSKPEAHHNHSDKDVDITWKLTTTDDKQNSGTNDKITIDSVAQQGDLQNAANYNEAVGDTGVGGNKSVIVEIPVSYTDGDGSEDHFLLVEKQPGIFVENPGASLVQIGGVTYYKVPLPNDHKSGDMVEVELSIGKGLSTNVDADSRDGTKDGTDTTAKDGSTIYKLGTGVLSVEKGPHDGFEVTGDNNTAFIGGKELEFKVSHVDTKISVSATPTYENGDGGEGYSTIKVTLTPDANDEVKEFSLTYDGSKGNLLDSQGNPLESDSSKGISITENADGTFTITFTPVAPATSLSKDTIEDINKGFRFEPDGYDHTDTSITWKVTVTDPLSNEKVITTEKETIVIDAVAQIPVVDTDNSGIDYGTGFGDAGVSGSVIDVNVNVNFPDDGTTTGEVHYAVVSRGQDWECNSATINGQKADVILIYDKDGNPYYAVQVPAGINDADVVFNIKLPVYTHDWDSSGIKIGGISTESFIQPDGDGEVTTGNNWSEGLKDIGSLSIGVVETDKSDIVITAEGKEDEPCELVFPTVVLDNNKESIEITIKESDLQGGKLFVSNGAGGWTEINADANGNYVLGGNDSYAYQGPANEHTPAGKEIEIPFSAKVTDDRSGVSKEFDDLVVKVEIEAVADAPDLTVKSQGMNDDKSIFTVVVEAKFSDIDGSENHYFLVKAVDGLKLLGGGFTLVDGANIGGVAGEKYYQFNAGSRVGSVTRELQFAVEPGFNPDSKLEIYGYSKETSNDDISALDAANASVVIDNLPFELHTVNGTNQGGEADFSNLHHMGVKFTGGSGADTVTGSDHNDIINLGNGNDYIYGSGGNDTLIGGAGFNTLDYSKIGGGTGIIAELAEGRITLGDPNAGGWQDTVSGFEQFIGTAADDTIHASGDEIIYGGKGNDTLVGSDGVDTFAWAADDLGDSTHPFTDTISDFTVGQDLLNFNEGIFDTSIEDMIAAAKNALGEGSGAVKSMTLNDNSGKSLVVDCSEQDSCTITVNDGNDAVQTIAVTGSGFGDYASANDLASLIEAMIKVDTGN